MVVVPRVAADREGIALNTHRGMGHFGVRVRVRMRVCVQDRIQKNYWWRGMGDSVVEVIKACLFCAKVVAYASRICIPAEQNYTSFAGECLAVVWATTYLGHFWQLLTLVTGHEPLRSIMTTQKLNIKLAKWKLLLQEHNFTTCPAGMENSADSLNKHPVCATHGAPILDWHRGDYNEAPHSYFATMVGEATSPLACHDNLVSESEITPKKNIVEKNEGGDCLMMNR